MYDAYEIEHRHQHLKKYPYRMDEWRIKRNWKKHPTRIDQRILNFFFEIPEESW
jgi:hypothetical protein